MPRPPHSPWLDLPNDIWGWVHIMKFLTVQLPPFSRHVIPLRAQVKSHDKIVGLYDAGLCFYFILGIAGSFCSPARRWTSPNAGCYTEVIEGNEAHCSFEEGSLVLLASK
jgi:hypothetical protein